MQLCIVQMTYQLITEIAKFAGVTHKPREVSGTSRRFSEQGMCVLL
jgi:hypothetical protein